MTRATRFATTKATNLGKFTAFHDGPPIAKRDSRFTFSPDQGAAMKNEDSFKDMTLEETDHDTQWRERIQRALRDLRSVSSNVEERTQRQTRSH